MEKRNKPLASEVIAAVKRELMFFKALTTLLIVALLIQGLYEKR